MTSTPGPLTHERNVLRHILDRLMNEDANLDSLCKYIPRLVTTAANVARIEAALDSSKQNDDIDALRTALRELESDQPDPEETQW